MAIIPLGGGGSENLNTELTTQESLIDAIQEALVGKATGADATADKILSPYKAYVGQKLITGTYVPQVVTIDGVQVSEDLAFVSDDFDLGLAQYPQLCNAGCGVVLNDEIHILGGTDGNGKNGTYHYKWDGSEWTSVSTLPYSAGRASAVVLNGEIHYMGGSGYGTVNSNDKIYSHYKWNGSSWTSVSTLPYALMGFVAVVLNDEIHIFGTESLSSYYKAHYKWNGSEWTSVSTLPYDFREGSVVIVNGEIHILGGRAGATSHYKWNGSEWTSVSTLPYDFYCSSAVVLNGEIHILGSYNTTYRPEHYKWNGSSWVKVNTLLYSMAYGLAVVWRNMIYTLGGLGDGSYRHFGIVQYSAYTKS